MCDPVHRTLLKLHLEHIDELTTGIAAQHAEIDHPPVRSDTVEADERLGAIPGVNSATAQVIMSELGLNMSRFLI